VTGTDSAVGTCGAEARTGELLEPVATDGGNGAVAIAAGGFVSARALVSSPEGGGMGADDVDGAVTGDMVAAGETDAGAKDNTGAAAGARDATEADAGASDTTGAVAGALVMVALVVTVGAMGPMVVAAAAGATLAAEGAVGAVGAMGAVEANGVSAPGATGALGAMASGAAGLVPSLVGAKGALLDSAVGPVSESFALGAAAAGLWADSVAGLLEFDAGEARADGPNRVLGEALAAAPAAMGADTVVGAALAAPPPSCGVVTTICSAKVSTGSPLLGLYVTLSNRPHDPLVLNMAQYTSVTLTETLHWAVVQLSMPCCK
jgi:hypothetical protein